MGLDIFLFYVFFMFICIKSVAVKRIAVFICFPIFSFKSILNTIFYYNILYQTCKIKKALKITYIIKY